MAKQIQERYDRPGYELAGFYSSFFNKKTGKRVYAHQYGKKAFPIWRKVKK
jgi:hypothetical protein